MVCEVRVTIKSSTTYGSIVIAELKRHAKVILDDSP